MSGPMIPKWLAVLFVLTPVLLEAAVLLAAAICWYTGHPIWAGGLGLLAVYGAWWLWRLWE